MLIKGEKTLHKMVPYVLNNYREKKNEKSIISLKIGNHFLSEKLQ